MILRVSHRSTLTFLHCRFYSTDSTFIHGGVDRPGCVEQPAVGPANISQRIQDLNLRDCHAKIRQVDSHPTIGDGVVVQVNCTCSDHGNKHLIVLR